MTANLPTGTVTFLFTDIEGSTRLLDEVGPSVYSDLLARHHRLCRGAWAKHGGAEMGTAGDAFFVAFARATEAIAAAADAQAALAQLGLRVRMGVNSGEAALGDAGYVGIAVHRSARIAAAAHGGQVLVSATTAALLATSAECPVLRDLGEHRFKDLAASEHIFQLGESDFPAIRSLAHTNLPAMTTPFLGRAREVAEVASLLSGPGAALVTLTGPGGAGKTRLAVQAALEAADAFPDGVYWVPLAPLRDEARVLVSIAQVAGVKDQPGVELIDALAARMRGRRLLLVLDNAEHLMPALATVVAGLRTAAPGISLLVTSRERLRLSGEQVWLVPPLAEPEGLAFFVERARALGVQIDDSHSGRELCARLDNLPLALELAAARTPLFSPAQLLERIGQRLDMLRAGHDSDPRQQTLRAAIDWSYDLLAAEEQRVYRGLSVFVGGCSFEAAEMVVGATPDTLQSLLDKSLVRRVAGGDRTRFAMLETIREHAAERLADDAAAEQAWARSQAYLVELAEQLARDYYGRGMRVAVAQYVEESANIRAALERCRTDPVLSARFVTALASFWADFGEYATGREMVNRVLERAVELPPDLLPRFLVAASIIVGNAGDYTWAVEHAGRGLDLLQGGDDALWIGRALTVMGTGEANLTHPAPSEAAEHWLRQALDTTRMTGDDVFEAIALLGMSGLKQRVGETQQALEQARQAATLGARLGHARLVDWAFMQQAFLARARGDLDLCRTLVREAMVLAEERDDLPDPAMLAALADELISVEMAQKQYSAAAQLIGATQALIDETGLVGGWQASVDEHLHNLHARARDDVVEAAFLAGLEMTPADLVALARGE